MNINLPDSIILFFISLNDRVLPEKKETALVLGNISDLDTKLMYCNGVDCCKEDEFCFLSKLILVDCLDLVKKF
jgi:hypothetical protein